jgi:hypothetical protein
MDLMVEKMVVIEVHLVKIPLQLKVKAKLPRTLQVCILVLRINGLFRSNLLSSSFCYGFAFGSMCLEFYPLFNLVRYLSLLLVFSHSGFVFDLR